MRKHEELHTAWTPLPVCMPQLRSCTEPPLGRIHDQECNRLHPHSLSQLRAHSVHSRHDQLYRQPGGRRTLFPRRRSQTAGRRHPLRKTSRSRYLATRSCRPLNGSVQASATARTPTARILVMCSKCGTGGSRASHLQQPLLLALSARRSGCRLHPLRASTEQSCARRWSIRRTISRRC